MKILLTGGSGFLGGNFLEKFGKKYDVFAPTFAEMNLLRMASVNHVFTLQKFDAVVHLAGRFESDSATVAANNLIMFKNIQYAAIRNGVKKLLLAGDAADLDLTRPLKNACEYMFGEVVPANPYGLSRYLMYSLAAKDKISTVLRFFSVYGKGADVGSNPIGAILARAITGKKAIEIPQDKLFSTVYVEDAVKIINAFLENDFPRGTYNVASDVPITLTEVAKKARAYAKKIDRDVAINVLYEGEANEMTANNEQLKLILPTLKFTSHATGIQKTLEFLQLHKPLCRPKEKIFESMTSVKSHKVLADEEYV